MKRMWAIVFAIGTAAAATPRPPLWFEPNRGQVVGRTEWIARSSGGVTYITGAEVVFALATQNVRMRLVNAATSPRMEGLEPLESYSNYFAGQTEREWFTGIPHYAKVRYRNVYPGIDVVYHASGQSVEYDFEVSGRADPGQIQLAFSEPVRIVNGDLVAGGVRQHRPRVFQNGREIAADYRISPGNQVTLALAKYDRRKPLTIDPVLEFSTFLGGPGDDSLRTIAVDKAGFVYLAGYTQTPATPILDPFQQPNIVVYAPIIFKFSADGKRLIFYTTIDSNSWGWINAIAVDASGRLITAGGTWATNFPLKTPIQSDRTAAYTTGFVTKFSPDGRSILFSTLLGGSVEDLLQTVAVDAAGDIYVGGSTQSKDFPIRNALQPNFAGGYRDCFVTRISAAGSLVFSTFFGGSGTELCDGMTLAPDGGILIAGSSNRDDLPLKNAIQTQTSQFTGQATAFVSKFAPDGQSLMFSTFFGGPVSSYASAVATDTAGNIYLGGSAQPKFVTKNAFQPTAPFGASPAFVAKFDSKMANLIFATYLGGSALDYVLSLAVDPNGSVIVGGSTSSADFPMKNALQPFRGGGISNTDLFVAKLSPAGDSLIYATPIGGAGNENGGYLALDAMGNAYVTGFSGSAQDFPTKNAYQKGYGGGRWDAVFLKLSDSTPPAASPLSAQPGRILFKYVQGGPVPASQTATVSATAAGQAFTATSSDPWLLVSSPAPSAPALVTISVNPGAVTPGTYNGTIRLTPQAGATAAIDVTLSVLAAGPVLTEVAPTLLPVGSDDSAILIRGSSFTKESTLQIDGIPWLDTPVIFVDANTLRTTLPRRYLTVEYNHTVAVQNPNSALSNVIALAVGRPAPQIANGGTVNAASYTGGAIAPGEVVTIFGSNFGTLENTRVLFDLVVPATPIYVTASQLSVTVPYTVAGHGKTDVAVESAGLRSAPMSMQVADSSPGLFTINSSGKGQGAILNQDGGVNSSTNPAAKGSVVVLYGTGGGVLTADELPRLSLPVVVSIAGVNAELLYAGVAPGLVEGAIQINVRIPAGAPSGAQPVVLQVSGQRSQADVTLAIQ